MHPAAQPPPQNRSCPSPSPAQCLSPSPTLIQQQQHVLYGPITTLQPCPTPLHPHCVYTGVQRNPGLPGTAASLTNQGKWQPKSKPSRSHQHNPSQQQYCQPLHQQHVQQPLSYIHKPLIVFDQCTTNQPNPGAPPSAGSFLVASSAFGHGPYGPGDPYSSASCLTLIPQPYFKPPDVPQAFCLLPERPQHQQQLPAQSQGSYYNISATTACSLQAINPKTGYQLTNVANPYANLATFGNAQFSSGQAVPTSQIFQNPPVSHSFGIRPRDKIPMVSNVDLQAVACSSNSALPRETKLQFAVAGSENIDWPVHTRECSNSNSEQVPDTGRSSGLSTPPEQDNQPISSTFMKNQEDHYSDESTASFDFTIEAEKMVSALCNTVSSNDLGKDETRGRNDLSPSFSGAAGDNVANKTNLWFADFCAEYGVSVGENYRAASTQTQEERDESQQYPESMRKTIYWGCNEAEGVLNSGSYRGSTRAEWLANICSATRTAVTKSSTCFPIFSGDRTFVQDLVNAHLRISNGWLVLDNYLNKQQHYPSLNEKYDRELTTRFQSWEAATHDLLGEIVRTFVKIEDDGCSSGSTGLDAFGRQENLSSNSFPGDVSLYMNNDLFDLSQRCNETTTKLNNDEKTDRDTTYTLQYAPQSTSHPNFRSSETSQQPQKETKLRSKWTITENLSSTIDSTKLVSDISLSQNDHGYSGNRFRVKNASTSSSAKIGSSGRHSLNAEFVHLRNTVMESIGNCNELEKQRWGLKENQYDFVLGASRARAPIVARPTDPILKITTPGNAYANAYNLRTARMDSTHLVDRGTATPSTKVDGAVHLVSNAETAMDSTYTATDRNRTYADIDYTSSVGAGECGEYDCASGLVVSATSITSLTPDPVYVGKSSSDQRELDAVPRTKMTLLSQIEGDASTTGKHPKEMTANLSAWFASMRKSTGRRGIPSNERKNEHALVTRTSTHPQETSRSAMDLNRQLHMDGNRQLATLQNMQTIQSQPWNACNLLNNKRSSAKVHHHDEYDSSEDVRVYMKPGSYNVPKKRHSRKNARRSENPGSSKGTNHTPRIQTSRGNFAGSYNFSNGKNNQASLMIVSSVQVSTTTTNTSTTIRIPFPASPIVPPPANFGLENSTRILRRVRTVSNQETRQDVAWKAACASAEILLGALSVKDSADDNGSATRSVCSTGERNDYQASDSSRKTIDESCNDYDYRGASSYEASEDDSDATTCKFSPRSDVAMNPREIKQRKTNVKTDSWLIRTLNNASIVSNIEADESDESTIGESLNSPIHEDRREHQKVVTSTPEPSKIDNEDSAGSRLLSLNSIDTFQERSDSESPSRSENRDKSTSNTRQTLPMSLVDSSSEFTGRPTYSETVRRSTGKTCSALKREACRSRQTRATGTSVPTVKTSDPSIPGKKAQRRDNDRTYQLLQKSRKSVGKKLSRDSEGKPIVDILSNKNISKEDACVESSVRRFNVKTQVKKREDCGARADLLENKSKASDRGWSVWYSSRRRQSLSPFAFDKLATVHQTVWQMDGAQILENPTASSNVVGDPTGTSRASRQRLQENRQKI